MTESSIVWRVCARACLVASIVMIVAVLTGCQTTKPVVITEVQVQRIEVPAGLLTCSAEPVYGKVSVTAKDLMKYVDQMAKAGADCRLKLEAVRRIVEAKQNSGF